MLDFYKVISHNGIYNRKEEFYAKFGYHSKQAEISRIPG